MNWWKNRRKTYKITFSKASYNFKGTCLLDASWEEISDSAILTTVFEIADILNIKVISTNISSCSSTIKIRCTAEDKIKFIRYFTKILNNKITDITF